MRYPMYLPTFLLAVGGALPPLAEAQLTKPPTTSPTLIVAPSWLTATGKANSILLTFPAVAGASGYRVTRTNNAGDPETIIIEANAVRFNFLRAPCATPSTCAYTDTAVSRGYLYSYRVYSLFPNSSGPPIVSPPGPVASAQLK